VYNAAATAGEEDKMTLTLDQIDLVCADMDASIAFYRLLGAKIPKASIWRTKSGAHHVRAAMSGGVELSLNSPGLARVYNKGYRRNRGGGNLSIGFSVTTRGAVDRLYAKMTAAGHAGLSPPWDAFWGARYATIADPDGNHVGLMSPSDPKKRWPGPEL
jgi:catechol 2,3-dioxygenase-like lactoylglutathione lyase family enzyme